MFCFHCLCICNTLVCSSLVEEIKNIIIITFVYQSLRRYTVLALDRSKYLPSSPIAYMFQYGFVIPFLLRILIRMRRTRTTLIVADRGFNVLIMFVLWVCEQWRSLWDCMLAQDGLSLRCSRTKIKYTNVKSKLMERCRCYTLGVFYGGKSKIRRSLFSSQIDCFTDLVYRYLLFLMADGEAYYVPKWSLTKWNYALECLESKGHIVYTLILPLFLSWKCRLLLRLLHIFKCTSDYFFHGSKQYEPWSDCFRVHIVCNNICKQWT